jgi:hypothetical protein
MREIMNLFVGRNRGVMERNQDGNMSKSGIVRSDEKKTEWVIYA